MFRNEALRPFFRRSYSSCRISHLSRQSLLCSQPSSSMPFSLIAVSIPCFHIFRDLLCFGHLSSAILLTWPTCRCCILCPIMSLIFTCCLMISLRIKSFSAGLLCDLLRNVGNRFAKWTDF